MGHALGELTDLVARAKYDLEHGWARAAFDALGRAAAIVERLEQEHSSRLAA